MATGTLADKIEWIETFLASRDLFGNDFDRLWKLLGAHRLNERDPADGCPIPDAQATAIVGWLYRNYGAGSPDCDPGRTLGVPVSLPRPAMRAARPRDARPPSRPAATAFAALHDDEEVFYAIANPDTSDRENPVIFLKADKPKEGRWAGRTFIKREFGGPRYERLTFEEQAAYARMIVKAGVAESMQLYGQVADRCCFCHRPLSRRTPRFNGRGNDCAKDRGLTQARPPADWRPELRDAA